MAITKAGLSAAILAAREAEFGAPDDADIAQKDADAIADAVVTYLKANALVNVTVASVSGVTPGPGASGPGSGTGTIT